MDSHFWILVFIIIFVGAFGGVLNYLHNFDTSNDEGKSTSKLFKYLFLGIGSAALVPAFLKMIASDMIKKSDQFDNLNYLIFAGFCLVAAIFSRRFISTIGERVLEAAKQAELSSKETRKQYESTKLELSSAQERIEDVKLAVNLRNNDKKTNISVEEEQTKLLELVDSFLDKTSIADYADRLKKKAELGRKMGQIIVRHDLPKEDLLAKYPKEGMYLAIAYAIDLKPEESSLTVLNQLAKVSSQLYTKYVILVAYRTMASSGFISREQAMEISKIIGKFRADSDRALLRNIDDTLNVLKFINPDI